MAIPQRLINLIRLAPKTLAQSLAVDKLRSDVVGLFRLADFEDRQNVGMVKSEDGASLVLETSYATLFGR